MKPETKLGRQLQSFNRIAGLTHLIQGVTLFLILNDETTIPVITRFFDEKVRKENGVEADTQRLILPGEEGTDGECDFSKMFEDVGVKTKKPEEPVLNASSPPVIVHASNN
jgi:hypothetical protein